MASEIMKRKILAIYTAASPFWFRHAAKTTSKYRLLQRNTNVGPHSPLPENLPCPLVAVLQVAPQS